MRSRQGPRLAGYDRQTPKTADDLLFCYRQRNSAKVASPASELTHTVSS